MPDLPLHPKENFLFNVAGAQYQGATENRRQENAHHHGTALVRNAVGREVDRILLVPRRRSTGRAADKVAPDPSLLPVRRIYLRALAPERGPEVLTPGKGPFPMTHVVCEPCYDCKYTDCCVVCPVECFYQDDMMLYIDPVDCIDCEACVPECPVEAIFVEANVPPQWANWTQVN